MNIREFDFDLPSELIVQHPAQQRASSRLLHLDSASRQIRDLQFSCLPEYLQSEDVAVFNDTRVIKARLFGRKSSGGKIEILVERVLDDHHVQATIRASHAPRPDSRLVLADEIPVTVLDRGNAFYTLRFDHPQTVYELLERFGQLPLPPYIGRSASLADESRYQTVYAKNAGAVAAPTAGLHFDETTLNQLKTKGVMITYVTLHVGAGTFQPVRVEKITDHTMHSELFHIPQQTADAIGHAKKKWRSCSGSRYDIITGARSFRCTTSRSSDCGLRRNRYLYYTGLSFSRGRSFVDQFSFAAIHPDYAGQRIRWPEQHT